MHKALIASLFFAFVIGGEARAEDPPSRILINGVVLTMDKSDRVAQAIAINGDRIVAVGSNAEIGKLADARTNVVDVGWPYYYSRPHRQPPPPYSWWADLQIRNLLVRRDEVGRRVE